MEIRQPKESRHRASQSPIKARFAALFAELLTQSIKQSIEHVDFCRLSYNSTSRNVLSAARYGESQHHCVLHAKPCVMRRVIRGTPWVPSWVSAAFSGCRHQPCHHHEHCRAPRPLATLAPADPAARCYLVQRVHLQIADGAWPERQETAGLPQGRETRLLWQETLTCAQRKAQACVW